MLGWISAHSSVLTVVANFTMVGVWVIYLQLFWKSYRRQLQANILITPGAGTGLEARCLISNMSAEAIHIEAIFLVLEREGERWSTALTTLHRVREDEDAEDQVERAMHQGPLQPGAFVDVGKFADLVESAREALHPDGALGPPRSTPSRSGPSPTTAPSGGWSRSRAASRSGRKTGASGCTPTGSGPSRCTGASGASSSSRCWTTT